ncbi:hypothetical protein C5D34_09800 [Rathayibacter sp. AY1B1]|nr:hypothetical protein C5D08_13040 [Rathayibacter sp. AY1B6]PPI34332.1 hypothetical protein C5D34_09800 [Rathayibacter sp. AY1B1]
MRLALGWVPDRTIALTFAPLDGTATQSCTAYFHVQTDGGTPSAASLVRARTFIANVDTDSIQMDEEMLKFQRESFDGVEPRPTDVNLQISAYAYALGTAMADDLQANGYTEDSYLISMRTDTDCGDGIMQ